MRNNVVIVVMVGINRIVRSFYTKKKQPQIRLPFLVEHSIELSNNFIEDWKRIIEFNKYIKRV